jgi:hypothetical protein
MTLRKIDGFVVDGVLEEEVRYETTVTDYPIESGGKASDHIENATPVLTMTFIVSDTPIGEVAKQRSADTIPSNEAKRYLLELRAARRPFTVEGVTGTYPLMVFASLSEPRDSESGDALVMEAEFRQLRIEEVRREVVRGPANLGHRPAAWRDGPPGWLCPDLVVILGDPAANAAKKCRKVVSRRKREGAGYGESIYVFADTGVALNYQELADYFNQQSSRSAGGALDGSGTGTAPLSSQLAYDPRYGAVRRGVYANRGNLSVVATPATPAELQVLQEYGEAQNRQADVTNTIFGGAGDKLFTGPR